MLIVEINARLVHRLPYTTSVKGEPGNESSLKPRPSSPRLYLAALEKNRGVPMFLRDII